MNRSYTFASPKLEQTFRKHEIVFKQFADFLDEVSNDIRETESRFKEHGVCLPYYHEINTYTSPTWNAEDGCYRKRGVWLAWLEDDHRNFRLMYLEGYKLCDKDGNTLHENLEPLIFPELARPFSETKAHIRVKYHHTLAGFSEAILERIAMYVDPHGYFCGCDDNGCGSCSEATE